MVQRLLKDADYFSSREAFCFCSKEVVVRATYLSKIMYGGRTISIFELVSGYTPRITDLLWTQISKDIIEANKEQIFRLAIARFQRMRIPNIDTQSKWSRDDHVYFYKRGKKAAVEIGSLDTSGASSLR